MMESAITSLSHLETEPKLTSIAIQVALYSTFRASRYSREVRVLVVLAAALVHWLISVLNPGIATVPTNGNTKDDFTKTQLLESPHKVALWFHLQLATHLRKYLIKLYKTRGLYDNLGIISTNPRLNKIIYKGDSCDNNNIH